MKLFLDATDSCRANESVQCALNQRSLLVRYSPDHFWSIFYMDRLDTGERTTYYTHERP